jgi:hypothetical protein
MSTLFRQKNGITPNYKNNFQQKKDTFLSELRFKFIDDRNGKWHFTKKWNTILRNNIAEAKEISETGYLLKAVRNNAEHLNVLTNLPKYVDEFRKGIREPMTSYFELYHFVLQKMLCEELGEVMNDYAQRLNEYHTPCDDLIKLAFVSLGYNLPRYKNLTIEPLFDPDSESGKELTANRNAKEEAKKAKRQES